MGVAWLYDEVSFPMHWEKVKLDGTLCKSASNNYQNTHLNNVKIAIRDRESYDENLANHFKHHLRYMNLGKFEHLCDIYKYIKLQGRLFSFLFLIKNQTSKMKGSKTNESSAISWYVCLLCTFRICPAFTQSQDMNMLLGEMINLWDH